MTPIECMYESIRSRVGHITSVEFSKFMLLDGWEFIPVEHEGEIRGSVMVKGNEVHIGIVPESQGKIWLRSVIRKQLAKLFNDHDELVTYIHGTHSVGHRLAVLIGFERGEMTNRGVKYTCTKVKI